MTNLSYQQSAWNDWAWARRKAFVQAIRDWRTEHCSALVLWQDVHVRLPLRGSQYRGLQQVPLANIVGSAGRYADFDRSFLPQHDHLAQRWQRIALAHYHGQALPPIEVYQLGAVYFVKDGHHRVSVARAHGWKAINAYVTEYVVDVPLDEHLSVHTLLLKEEYSDFLEWTQLHRVRPQQRIEFSALGGYLELVAQINTQREELAQERGEDVAVETAVARWYDQVYLPLVELIRQQGILSHCAGRTEADLYLWIMHHRHTLQQSSGVDRSLDTARLDDAAQCGRRSIQAWVGKIVWAFVRSLPYE